MVFFALSAIAACTVFFTWNSIWSNQALDVWSYWSQVTPTAPRFVAYMDAYDGNTGPPPVAQAAVIIYVFYLSYLVLNWSPRATMSCEFQFLLCRDPSLMDSSNLAFLLLQGPWDKVCFVNSMYA